MQAARNSIWHRSACEKAVPLTAAFRYRWKCEQTGGLIRQLLEIQFNLFLFNVFYDGVFRHPCKVQMQIDNLSSSSHINWVSEVGPCPRQQNSLCFLGVV